MGRRKNNMIQIRSIKLGLIAICFATIPLSQAQMPRTRTSGSNQIGVTTGATVGHSGLSGNSTSAGQLGTNFRSSTDYHAEHECRRTHRDKRWRADRHQQSNRWDYRGRRWWDWWLKQQRDWGYAAWDECPDWHEYHGEHERRSAHCRRRYDACQRQYYSAPTRPGAN